MKWVCGIEYDGTKYFGWQKQKLVCTIQESIENVLSKIANHNINLICAGRTDRGVHGITQIVHFLTFSVRSKKEWLLGANSLLPSDITILWLKKIPENFDARFSALSRSYRYIIFNSAIRSSFLKRYSYHLRKILDIKKMKHASQYLIGQHNFSAFRSSGCQSLSPYRTIFFIHILQFKKFIIIDIIANSFLYHMVRNIVGCLVLIGLSIHEPLWIKQVLDKKDHHKKYSTAPSHGLYFLSASYPSHFLVPNNIYKSSFLIFFNI
ncbi:pseudouridylate synthase I [Buchnera aphidicola (Cinara tujafilina)]|uniref:tRNA pseudouridine synthase A n=1 Tax=Buchnera aphidicola (Cinara tujafilina) TaxID=261317 RepID=F7WZ68_9GAMM|nr:tRNA pseudouridine(38-40) synthase TruA [Buchnera aphidicola]AEH39722.1 pseudouridylate synthase I [Buchnera aphidicola (Cinara tujafilina)]